MDSKGLYSTSGLCVHFVVILNYIISLFFTIPCWILKRVCHCFFHYIVLLNFLTRLFVLFLFLVLGTPSKLPPGIPLPDKRTLEFILYKLQK